MIIINQVARIALEKRKVFNIGKVKNKPAIVMKIWMMKTTPVQQNDNYMFN